MGVMMRAFHWDCPKVDNREFVWWPFVRERMPSHANGRVAKRSPTGLLYTPWL
jgi:hypothetical protein